MPERFDLCPWYHLGSNMPKTVCLDFDGVIHSYSSGWQGYGVADDPPVPGAAAAIVRYLDAGLDVAVYSSRSKSFRGRLAMKRYVWGILCEYFKIGIDCKDQYMSPDIHVAEHYYYGIKWPWFKPPAFVTVDDRAIRFQGVFPLPKEIKDFRPWNKQHGRDLPRVQPEKLDA